MIKFPWQKTHCISFLLLVVQLLSRVQLFDIPWTIACQASLPCTTSRVCCSRHESQTHVHWVNDVIQPSHPVSSPSPPPSIFTSIRAFSNESAVHIRWPKYGASASASVLPMNIQGWYHLWLTGLIFLLSKEASRVLSSTTVQKQQFFGTQPSLRSNSPICTWLLEKS